MIYNQKTGEFVTSKGPIFANLILADEINRTPPKVQSALLEAMQERQVTIGDQIVQARRPVPACSRRRTRSSRRARTRCPRRSSIASCSRSRSPTRPSEEEREIVERIAIAGEPRDHRRSSMPADIVKARELCKSMLHRPQAQGLHPRSSCSRRASRRGTGLPELKPLIRFGASPRASINLTTTARAMAFLAPPRVRDPRGREGAGGGRAAAPHHPVLRGRGRGDDGGRRDPEDPGVGRSAVSLRVVRQPTAPASPRRAIGNPSHAQRSSSSRSCARSSSAPARSSTRTFVGEYRSTFKGTGHGVRRRAASTCRATTSARSTGRSRRAWTGPTSRSSSRSAS